MKIKFLTDKASCSFILFCKIYSFVQFFIWDFPGQIDFFDPTFDCQMIFGDCGALVFVIDAQDDYTEALAKLNQTVKKAYKVNPKIKFEVFIHKVDGVSDDFKMESQRDIATVRNKSNRSLNFLIYLCLITESI